jgi:hypothetical protein
VVPSQTGKRTTQLEGVSCLSAAACTAAGFHLNLNFRTLVESDADASSGR